MRVLVTGGTGFVGSAIARRYLEQGDEVIVTGTRTEQAVPGATLLESHFSGIDLLRLKHIDLVFHEAANNDTLCQDWQEMNHANLFGPKKLFEWLARDGTSKFVYASSTAVYGNGPAPYEEKQDLVPLNPYAVSKMLFEQWVTDDFLRYTPGIQAVGLRYCNVYGPGECHKGKRSSMIRQIAVDMIKGKRPRLFKHGEQRRDWVYVQDVVDANFRAALYPGSGVFNCGSGVASSFNDIVAAVNTTLGADLQPVYIDNPFSETYQSHTECGMKKAADFLQFLPRYDLATGVKEYVPYLKEKYG